MDIIKKFKVHLIKFGGIIYLSPFDEPKGGKLSRGEIGRASCRERV